MAIVQENPVDKYLRRNKDLTTEKAAWDPHYQRLAEVFLTRKQYFTSSVVPGEFLYDDIYDNTGEYAAQKAAAVYLSMLWPDSARTFVLRPVDEIAKEPGVEEFFRFCTNQVRRYMDKPKAGLLLALQEHFLDSQVFGTSGVGTFDNEDDESCPLAYEAWGVGGMKIAENAQGYVDTIYCDDPMTVRQVIEKYGRAPDQVHETVLAKYKEGRLDDKVQVLRVIETRPAGDRAQSGILSYPIRTLHIDVEHKFIMRESGYAEFPVAVGRMIKTGREVYGRSPAMVALPDAVSLNVLKEAVTMATEKQLDPPLGVLDDGRLGGGTIDTSAGAINVFNASGRLTGDKPVFPLYTVGELQSAEKLMTEYKDAIMQAFSLDRLLDLNNQTQMTAYETSIRNSMRGEANGALFSRQIAEVLTPVIERSFNILYRRGYLGTQDTGAMALLKKAWAKVLGRPLHIVPEIVLKAIDAGLDVFEIEYISPAQRFLQSEKLQGIFTATEFFTKIGVIPGYEELADNIDMDSLARDVVHYSGAPSNNLRTLDEVKKIREGRMAQQQAAAKLNAMQQASEIARNAGQAQASIKGGA